MSVNVWGSDKPMDPAVGGTGLATLTDASVMVANGSGDVELIGPFSKGQILVGVGGGGSPQLLDVGTDGQALMADSGETKGLKYGDLSGSSGPSGGDLTKMLVYDDFLTSSSEFSATLFSAGTESDADHPGVWNTSNGTTKYIQTAADIFFVDGGAMVCECVCKTYNTLVTSGGSIIVGFLDAAGNNGCYFRYQPSLDSNWVAVTRASGTATTTDTFQYPTLGTWRTMRIEVNAGGTSVSFSLDGGVVATHTTNIPANTAGMTGKVLVNANFTTVGFAVDALMFDKTFDGDRA